MFQKSTCMNSGQRLSFIISLSVLKWTPKEHSYLEAFREMLHVSPRIPSQSFAELPSSVEILEFLRYFGHSHEIRHPTDVNVNKLYQPWRSFALVINKCLTGKSSGVDSFRLSQAQILWGFYHRRNVDYAYLIWDDFVYQVEHKNQKKINEMYYPRFTKVIIDYFMTRKPSIPRQNKINWPYIRDDVLFSTIKVVSRHQTTQQYGVILPIELTTDDIRNSKAYKEYYACATGEAAPKPKASARKKKGDSASSTTPPTPTPTTTVVAAPRLSATAKGTGSRPRVLDVQSDDLEEELSWNSSDDEDVGEQTKEEELVKNDDEDKESGKGGDEDERNAEEDKELRLSEKARIQEEEEVDELYRDVNINQGRGLQVTQNIEDSHVTLTPVQPDGLQESSSVSSFVTSMLNPISDQMTEVVREAVQIQTDRLQDSLQRENDEFLCNIDENMMKIIKGQVKRQVKEQVSRILPRIEESVNATLEAEVLTRSSHSSKTLYAIAADLSEMKLKKILIEKIKGNKREDDDQEGPSAGSDRGFKRRREGGEHASASTLSKIVTRSTGRSTTGSQSRQLSASESAFAEEPVQTTCQMEEPSHPVFEIGADDQPIVQTSQHPEWFSQPRRPPLPDRDWNKTLPAAQGDAQSWISDLARQTDARSSFNELLNTPIDFSNFIMNRLGVATLTPELLAGPTYELMRGSCTSLTKLEYHLEEVYKATTDQLDWVNPEGQQYPHDLLQPLPLIPDNRGHRVIPFEHLINNDLEYLRGGALSRKYTIYITKTKAADYGHIKWIKDLVPRAMWIHEPINYNRNALWGVSHWGRKPLKEQLKGKAVLPKAVSLNPIEPALLQVDVFPLVPKLRKNRTAHIDYIKHTLEEAATHRELVESERLLSPLNTPLAYACKYTRRIQELLMILQQTCPRITDLGTNLVAVTPKNQTKQVRRTPQITKSKKPSVGTSPSPNIDSNTPVLSSTGVALISSASGSQSKDNTKKNRIRRTFKKAKETELEDHPRKVKSSLNKASVVDSRANSSVIKSVSNVNSNLKCASCNGSLFSDNHDKCVVEYINSVNASRKSKSAKKPVNRKVWKTTGKVFKTVR
nr:hypothetical protein [Tanacetum cinerariifolium]